MTTWNEFLDKIRLFKKEKVKTGMTAGSLIRLLFAGSFDEMLDAETMKIPAVKRYNDLAKELLEAMGSHAQLPKATGDELVGINKIETVPQLILWRHSVNPFARYDVSSFCKSFLANEGFVQAAPSPTHDVVWFRPQSPSHHTQVDIRQSWSGLFDASDRYKQYMGEKLLGVMGVVVDVEKKPYQTNKMSMSVTIFTGREYIEGVRIWPEKSGLIKPSLTEGLTKFSVGLFIIKPKPWNDRPGGSIVGWTKVKGM